MFRFIKDIWLIGFVLAGVLAASQVPGFVQEYEQRLGGARDEVARMLVEFTVIARKSGDDLPGYVEKLSRNGDPAISATGRKIRSLSARETDLARQADDIAQASRLMKPVVMARAGDREIIAATWAVFHYSLTLDPEFGAIGLGVGWILQWFIAALLGTLRPKRPGPRIRRGRLHRD